MNNHTLRISLISLLSVSCLSLYAVMDKKALSQQVETVSKQLLAQLGRRIDDVTPKTITDMRNLVTEVDSFIKSKASSDKDILVPWATIMQSSDVILTYISLWSELARMNKIDKKALLANIDKLTAAIKDNAAASKKVKSTIFIRSDKKDAAALLQYFSDYLGKVGTAAQGVLNLKYNQTK